MLPLSSSSPRSASWSLASRWRLRLCAPPLLPSPPPSLALARRTLLLAHSKCILPLHPQPWGLQFHPLSGLSSFSAWHTGVAGAGAASPALSCSPRLAPLPPAVGPSSAALLSASLFFTLCRRSASLWVAVMRSVLLPLTSAAARSLLRCSTWEPLLTMLLLSMAAQFGRPLAPSSSRFSFLLPLLPPWQETQLPAAPLSSRMPRPEPPSPVPFSAKHAPQIGCPHPCLLTALPAAISPPHCAHVMRAALHRATNSSAFPLLVNTILMAPLPIFVA